MNTSNLIHTLSAMLVFVAVYAQAQAPGYKVSMVKSSSKSALAAVENGESPDQDCAMVKMQGQSIIKDHPDDTDAVVAATEAIEVCNFDVPVAHFGAMLDSVEEQLKDAPDDPIPCNDFVSAWAIYFSTSAGAAPGGEDPEERVKAALSERAHEVCPFSAGMMKF